MLDGCEDARVVGDLATRQAQAVAQSGQVAVAEQGDAVVDLDQEIALFVDGGAAELVDDFADMRFDPVCRRQAQDPGRVFEFDEYPLWAVLHEVIAVLVMRVLSVQEIVQAGVGDRFAAQAPAATAVQRQPAVTGRHIRPAQHGAEVRLTHASPAAPGSVNLAANAAGRRLERRVAKHLRAVPRYRLQWRPGQWPARSVGSLHPRD
jgi:hypothetical protein